jgi:hypothetical protein
VGAGLGFSGPRGRSRRGGKGRTGGCATYRGARAVQRGLTRAGQRHERVDGGRRAVKQRGGRKRERGGAGSRRQWRRRRGVARCVRATGRRAGLGHFVGLAEQARTVCVRQVGSSGPTWAVRAVLVGKGKMARAGLPLLGRDSQLG